MPASVGRKPKPENNTAFFYGTLMAPQVLHRVCHGSMNPSNPLYATHTLTIRPAILHSFRRHRVKNADYPAIIPRSDSTVRGALVTGLRDTDIFRLDTFEGDEYRRDVVQAKVLTAVGDEKGEGNKEGESVEAETYVWVVGEQRLEDAEWDFAEFQRKKLRRWIGREGQGEFAEVDAAVAAAGVEDGTGGRGVNGHIGSALLEEEQRRREEELLANAV